jgi:hypothetical protein
VSRLYCPSRANVVPATMPLQPELETESSLWLDDDVDTSDTATWPREALRASSLDDLDSRPSLPTLGVIAGLHVPSSPQSSSRSGCRPMYRHLSIIS